MKLQSKRFLLSNESKLFLFLIAFMLIFSILGQIISFGGIDQFVQKHVTKIAMGLVIMCGISMVDIKFWSSFAYVLYLACFCFLILVNFIGSAKLGAQRWIDLYFFAFQPSEFMKLILILSIAKYYSELSGAESGEIKNHLFPLAITIIPAFVILKQPDLGTAMLLFGVGIGLIFLAGFPTKACLIFGIGFLAICPLSWFFLHDYQKNRILNFINPEMDPLGTGYHILQSKIAIGSGHIWGKGLFKGTQSSLNFLPEKHTDFIFTTISEELGFFGSVLIILLFLALTFYIFWIGSNAKKSRFSRYLCYGLGLLLFSHVFINIGMVIGILPVVGVPLPFLSYGGSSMITFMICCGLILAVLSPSKSYEI